MTTTLGTLDTDAKGAFYQRLRSGGMFADQDVTPALYYAAVLYLTDYSGDNAFLRDVQRGMADKSISTAQARGTLNVMLAGLRRNLANRTEAVTAASQVAPLPAATAQVKAIERAKDEKVRLYKVEGRPGVYRTRSKSDPSVHYTVMVHGGVESCSCTGFEHRQLCKHIEAARSKVAREAHRKGAK